MHLVAASTQILDLKLNLNDILNSILNGAQAWLLELWMDCCTLQDSTALQSMNGEQRRPVMENRQGKRTSSGPPNWQRWAPAHTNTGTEPSAEAERGTYRLHLADKRAQTNPVCWDPRTSPGSQKTEVHANACGPLFMCTSPSPCQAVSSVQTPTQWRKGRYQKKMTCRLAPALWGNVIAGLGSPGAFSCARLVVNPDNSMSHSCEWIRM